MPACFEMTVDDRRKYLKRMLVRLSQDRYRLPRRGPERLASLYAETNPRRLREQIHQARDELFDLAELQAEVSRAEASVAR